MLQQYTNKAIQKLRFLIRFLTITPAAIDAPPSTLQGTNRSYHKYVIFGHQRSGSSMIIGTLRKHPQIIGFGELFTANSVGFNIKDYDNHSIKAHALRNKYPVEFLDRYVFSSYRDDIRAVGFKLLVEHMDNDRFRCIWQWLDQHRELKIIYLARQNLLATYTSLLIAIKDGKFGIKDKSERSTTTININPKECLAEFQKKKYYNEEIKKCIKHHEVMEIIYEDLATEPYGYLKKFQKFIGVDICDLEISKVKQETRPLLEVIENYDELCRYFKQTEWEYLFDE